MPSCAVCGLWARWMHRYHTRKVGTPMRCNKSHTYYVLGSALLECQGYHHPTGSAPVRTEANAVQPAAAEPAVQAFQSAKGVRAGDLRLLRRSPGVCGPDPPCAAKSRTESCGKLTSSGQLHVIPVMIWRPWMLLAAITHLAALAPAVSAVAMDGHKAQGARHWQPWQSCHGSL